MRHVLDTDELLVLRLELLRRNWIFSRQLLKPDLKAPLVLFTTLCIMFFLVCGDLVAIAFLAGGVLLLPIAGATCRFFGCPRRSVQPEAVLIVDLPLTLIELCPLLLGDFLCRPAF